MRQLDLENDKSFPWSNVAILHLRLARGKALRIRRAVGFDPRPTNHLAGRHLAETRGGKGGN